MAMTMKTLILVAVTAAALGAAATAKATPAAILYDNGPANGTTDAWTINFGFAVADTFTLAGSSTLTEASFTTWNLPGDVTSQIDWAIFNNAVIAGNPTLRAMLTSGTVSISQRYQSTNGYGFAVNLDTIALPNVALRAGTYWFELQNAVVDPNDPAYWDINGGPSQIWESAVGYNPATETYAFGLNNSSDSFQILGIDPVPEPASIAWFGIGLAALGLARRRKAL